MAAVDRRDGERQHGHGRRSMGLSEQEDLLTSIGDIIA
jgi:hypothetical protein